MLRPDIKEAIERQFGKRQISKIINSLLFKELIKGKIENMFGVDKWLTKKKIRKVREQHNRV